MLRSRADIHTEVFGVDERVVSRACDNAVRRLRRKIEVDAAQPEHIITVHGEGYRFEPLHDARIDPSTVDASRPPTRPTVHLGDTALDLARHQVHRPNGAESLTSQDVQLLRRLLEARGG
ncbi:MAG: helix-turn-helix domain-containing protein, partial [Myxococcota bacterium]